MTLSLYGLERVCGEIAQPIAPASIHSRDGLARLIHRLRENIAQREGRQGRSLHLGEGDELQAQLTALHKDLEGGPSGAWNIIARLFDLVAPGWPDFT